MRAWIGLILLLGGCSGVEGRQPGGVAATQSESAAPIGCVEVGGGELQVGLTLGLGGGDVVVTAVQHKGGAAIGFNVSSTAPDLFFIVNAGDTSCTDGDSYLSASPISRVDFCSGANGCL
jgi:hypothetical protein